MEEDLKEDVIYELRFVSRIQYTQYIDYILNNIFLLTPIN